MNDLVINPASTTQRSRLLDEYFDQNVLAGKKFTCPFFKECSDSHQGLFYEGQLHHVGKHYDMCNSGNPFRVMVVGQEYGHGPSHVSMEDRSQMVVAQTGIQKSFSNRNPHMRGTTSVLRLIFGIPLGDDHANEFLQIEDDRFHLFDAFSLANYLLCSAISVKEGRRGKSTPIMRRNCLSHFKKAVEILEPTIVIVQGKSYWTSIQKAFSNVNKITDTFYTAEINQQSAMIAVFTHPSTPDNIHNWGRNAKTPYLLNTVVPTILSIRQRLFTSSKLKGEFIMPTISEQPSRSPYSPSGKPDYDKIFS